MERFPVCEVPSALSVASCDMPGSWNGRFELHRKTCFLERPLERLFDLGQVLGRREDGVVESDAEHSQVSATNLSASRYPNERFPTWYGNRSMAPPATELR